MKPKIYAFTGDGGYLFSMGFVSFANSFKAEGYEVEVFSDSGRNTAAVRADVLSQPKGRDIIFLGYSLGANGCAWNAQATGQREIALIVGWDPTKNGPSLALYPIGGHVKRCVCFVKKAAVTPEGWFFGGSRYYAAKDGPRIVTRSVGYSHLGMQFNSEVRSLTAAEIRGVG